MELDEIVSEQINELPLLLGVMEQMGIRALLDQYVKPHGAWQGASVGTLVVIWLAHILSERQHRLVAVREWSAQRGETLNRLLEVTLRPTDCSDDRLANVLSMLGKASVQEELDQAMLQRWIRVYRLPTDTVRLDSTSVSVYHQETDPEGLLHLGHSKDHRPDLQQFKTMLATLDPLGMPVCAQTVAGNDNDDPLYVPAYEKAVAALGTRDVLVVGDCKMAALATRGHLAAQNSRYLCAYRPGGIKPEVDAWVQEALNHRADWQVLPGAADPDTMRCQPLAEVYEWTRAQSWTNPDTGGRHDWQERVLLVRSPRQQQAMLQRRQRRLGKLHEQLQTLCLAPRRGRKRYVDRQHLQALVDSWVEAAGMTGLVAVTLVQEMQEGQRPRWVFGEMQVDAAAWAAMEERLGWQVYLTNTSPHEYSALALIGVYHQQVIHERGFSRLKTRNLHVRPVYLRDQERIAGLMWLLCLALRVLTLTEYRLRTTLSQRGESLVGLNPAVPTQATSRPTTERVLGAFQNITLTIIQAGDRRHTHVTPLTPMQRRVLALLDLPASLYECPDACRTNSPPSLPES